MLTAVDIQWKMLSRTVPGSYDLTAFLAILVLEALQALVHAGGLAWCPINRFPVM